MGLPTTDLIKCVIGGAISTERWSIGLWFRLQGLTSSPTTAQLNTTASDMLGGFNNTVWNPASNPYKAACTSDTTLDSATVYLYRSAGLVNAGTAAITPVAGTGTNAHPAYVAWVVTLLTGVAGRSKRGRVYFPATGIGINSATSRISSTTIMSNAITNFAAWLTAQALGQPAWPGTPGEAAVVLSQHLASTTDITSIRSDDLADTQHGRSRRLVASVINSHSV